MSLTSHNQIVARFNDFLESTDVEKYIRRPQRYLARGAWSRYVLSHLYCRQVQAFAKIQQHLDDRTYWRLLGRALDASVEQSADLELILSLLRAPRTHIDAFLFTSESRAFHARQPAQIRCWRGHTAENAQGLYYTTDKRVAERYAFGNRFMGRKAQVSEYLLPKRDCFCPGGKDSAVLYVPGLGDVQDRLYGIDTRVRWSEQFGRPLRMG